MGIPASPGPVPGPLAERLHFRGKQRAWDTRGRTLHGRRHLGWLSQRAGLLAQFRGEESIAGGGVGTQTAASLALRAQDLPYITVNTCRIASGIVHQFQ